MRATRATRHGLRRTAGQGVMALALLLGATMVAAPHAAAQANHLKVALQGDTSNVDLHLTTHYVSRVALLNVYEMLYTLGEDLSIQPMLADKHTISPDGLTYTITVRKGVKFHNGKVMDAKDVAYTLNRMRNQGCRSAEFKALVKDVEATDASTVRIGLNAPSGVFLANLANVICPVVIYPEGEVEKQGGAITKPVGTGPYEFVEWKKDAFLRVKKFKDYVADSRPSSGLAGKKVAIMETVDFIPIPDSSVRAAAIEKGDVDIAIELNIEDVARMKGKPGLWWPSKPGIAFDDLRFGFKKGPSRTRSSARRWRTPSTRRRCPRPGHGRPGQARVRWVPGRDAVPRRGARPGSLREAERPAGQAAHAGSRLQGGEGRPDRPPGAGPDRPGRGGHPGPAPGSRHERRREDARVGGPPGGLQQGRLRALLLGAHAAAGRRRLLLPDERVQVEPAPATRTPSTTASARKGARRSRRRTARRSTPSSSSSGGRTSPTTRPTTCPRWRRGGRTSRAGVTGRAGYARVWGVSK